jgi:hypothetical protein
MSGQALVAPDNIIAALQIKRARRVGQELRVADDDRHADAPNLLFGNGYQNDFGADARRVAHSNADARQSPAGALHSMR